MTPGNHSRSLATQRIPLDSVVNARELGGYALPGGHIRQGMLLRGGALDRASAHDLQLLAGTYAVRRIFDFRTSMEVKHAPDLPVDNAAYIWMPAFNEESNAMEDLALPVEAYRNLMPWVVAHAAEDVPQRVARGMYLNMVTNEFTQVQYAGFLQNILGTESGAVYWHCSQGKDRTGFGAALLLAALGADRALIMHDFEISNEVYGADVQRACDMVRTEAEREVIRTFLGVNPRYFAAALDLIDAEYGSMDAYLRGPICLSDQDIETLRKRYIA